MATIATDQGKSLVAKAVDAVKAHIRESGLRVGDNLPGEGYFAAGGEGWVLGRCSFRFGRHSTSGISL